MSEYLFLGRVIPTGMETEVEKKRKRSMQDAAIALQWNLINGIEENLEKSIDIYSILPVDSYPRNYADKIIKVKRFSHKEGARDILAGHINIYFIRRFFMKKCLNKYAKMWAKKNPNAKAVFMYTLNSAFLNAAEIIKNKCPKVKVCCIIADLPEFIDLSNNINPLLGLVKKNSVRELYKKTNIIDNYVLLTKYMADKMKITKPFAVVEGVATDIFKDKKIKENTENKSILYAGTLNERFGVKNLVRAFMMTEEKNFRLVICGTGDSAEWIKEQACRDKRICFNGRVERHEVLSIMQSVSVIINPRMNLEEFTKYSFPSKNLEALSSGTPLMAYKLDGIPDEYDEFIYYIEGDSVEALRNTLENILNKPGDELKAFGERARVFVSESKNAMVQTKKILKLIGEI